MAVTLPRRLKVSRDTARLVSKATYHDFVLALRELVANAHDAASPIITIDVDLSSLHRKIQFELPKGQASRGHAVVGDLGRGMDEDTFNEVFLNVGRSNKGAEPENRMGRPLIGQFGIGFISALPFCEEVIVETRSDNGDRVSGAAIRSRAILENIAHEVEVESDSAPPSDHEYRVEGWQRDALKSDPQSFTKIVLNGLTTLAIESIDAKWSGGYHAIGQRKDKKKITDKERLAFLSEWLSRILPLGYASSPADCFERKAEDDDHEKLRQQLLELLSQTLPKGYAPAAVKFNGKPLVRGLSDIHFPPLADGGPQLLEFEGKNGDWQASGVVWSALEPIYPVWTRGVAIRVADMSIGDPQYWDLNTGARYFGKLQHITGEFQVTGLNTGLRLDREGFIPGFATDEFLNQVRRVIADMDGDLQDIAAVVQQVRVVKKQVEAAMPKASSRPEAPTALARGSAYLQGLAEKAKTKGVKVSNEKRGEVAVPIGERRLNIDAAVGDALVSFKAGKNAVRITVEDGPARAADTFVDDLLSGGPRSIEIEARHEMFANPHDFRAFLRFLAVLRIAHDREILTKKQVSQLLAILEETFR